MYPFAWLSDHIQLIGWPTIIIFVWKASYKITKYVTRLEDSEEALKNTSSTLNLVTTNHLPHMQVELEKLNEAVPSGFNRLSDAIAGLRQDLLILMRSKKN